MQTMAYRQKMTVNAVVNKINDTDDVNWDNLEDEEDWEVESNVEDVDPLDLAQITDPTEEDSMDTSSITAMPVTNTPHTTSPNALTQISDVPSSTATMPLKHTTTQPSITSTTTTNTTSSPFSPPEFTRSVGPAVSLDSAATALIRLTCTHASLRPVIITNGTTQMKTK